MTETISIQIHLSQPLQTWLHSKAADLALASAEQYVLLLIRLAWQQEMLNALLQDHQADSLNPA